MCLNAMHLAFMLEYDRFSCLTVGGCDKLVRCMI